MITLMRIFFGKFHAFVNLATFEEKPFSLKKDVITASPSLDPDFSNPFNGTNYFAVCNHIVLPNIVRFSNFASRLLKISIKFDSNISIASVEFFFRAEVLHSFITTTVREESQVTPCDHKGTIGRVRTGDQWLPVLCHSR